MKNPHTEEEDKEEGEGGEEEEDSKGLVLATDLVQHTRTHHVQSGIYCRFCVGLHALAFPRRNSYSEMVCVFCWGWGGLIRMMLRTRSPLKQSNSCVCANCIKHTRRLLQ